jgi:hypothetical protein
LTLISVGGFEPSTPWNAELRGRVFALLRTLMQSTRPIGAIVAGYLLAGGDVARPWSRSCFSPGSLM